jgi:hypothetical protein
MKLKALTPAEVAKLRRFLHIVGQELVSIASSSTLPDQWDVNMGVTSYTTEAVETIYKQMAADGLLPKRG